ncbi:hypothetical protein [Rhodococcus sp. LW-XY12]|nr:hypothetical protein [Rhodococcus sp. LW-XY12]
MSAASAAVVVACAALATVTGLGIYRFAVWFAGTQDDREQVWG